jgi:hypothetical protein
LGEKERSQGENKQSTRETHFEGKYAQRKEVAAEEEEEEKKEKKKKRKRALG